MVLVARAMFPLMQKEKKNLQVHSLLLYMDLKLLHITHDAPLWAGCRRELALCWVLLWLVNVEMWYRSFSKPSWLEKSGHSGGKVNKISPSVPGSWCECERQRQGSTAAMVFQHGQTSWIPICQELFSSLHFFPAPVTQNQPEEPPTWQTTKSRRVSFGQGARSRPRIYYVLLSRMNKSVFISSV